MTHGAKAWMADFKHPHYQAARNAMVRGKTIKFNQMWFYFIFIFLSI
jgi:hypothetical protein